MSRRESLAQRKLWCCFPLHATCMALKRAGLRQWRVKDYSNVLPFSVQVFSAWLICLLTKRCIESFFHVLSSVFNAHSWYRFLIWCGRSLNWKKKYRNQSRADPPPMWYSDTTFYAHPTPYGSAEKFMLGYGRVDMEVEWSTSSILPQDRCSRIMSDLPVILCSISFTSAFLSPTWSANVTSPIPSKSRLSQNSVTPPPPHPPLFPLSLTLN